MNLVEKNRKKEQVPMIVRAFGGKGKFAYTKIQILVINNFPHRFAAELASGVSSSENNPLTPFLSTREQEPYPPTLKSSQSFFPARLKGTRT